MSGNIVIQGGFVVDPANDTERVTDILIKDGKIDFVGDYALSSAGEMDQIIDARGLAVLPGLVDMHVHLRDPGQTHKEDILSGCRAAAAGGVTSLLCMPNPSPPVDSAEVAEYMKSQAEDASVRVYMAGAATKGLLGNQISDYAELAAAGVIALTDDGMPVRDDEILQIALMNEPAMPVLCHCENVALAAGGKMRSGQLAEHLGVPGIPAEAEWGDVERTVALAGRLGARVHICHVSTKESLDIIRKAKAQGVKVTCETAPHYVAFTFGQLAGRDADYRMNPPLGDEDDRLAVLEALRDGTIDCVATDHAPHTPGEKADFLTAPNGVIGMETSLAAMLTYAGLSLSEIVRLMSYHPAKILGIPAGTLSVGAPADICIFDPNAEWTVDPDKLHGKSKNAVFKGCQLRGRVVMTMVGGEIIRNAEFGMQN